MPTLRLFAPEQPDYAAQIRRLRELLRGGELTSASFKATGRVPDIVRNIREQVAAEGDVAAARLGSELDRARLTPETLRVPEALIAEARAQTEPEFVALIRRAIDNIRTYQEHILWRSP